MAAEDPGIVARRVSVDEVRPLRLEVLRPGLPAESAVFAGDDEASTSHWGAYDPHGSLGAVASLCRAPKPGAEGLASDWQLRGMASDPRFRGKGYAAAVLDSCLEFIRSEGGPGSMLWCNARTSAVGFYERQGFRKEGGEFEIPGVGPHFVMWRRT